MVILHYKAFKLSVSDVTTSNQTTGVNAPRQSFNQMIVGIFEHHIKSIFPFNRYITTFWIARLAVTAIGN